MMRLQVVVGVPDEYPALAPSEPIGSLPCYASCSSHLHAALQRPVLKLMVAPRLPGAEPDDLQSRRRGLASLGGLSRERLEILIIEQCLAMAFQHGQVHLNRIHQPAHRKTVGPRLEELRLRGSPRFLRDLLGSVGLAPAPKLCRIPVEKGVMYDVH